jgi:hypothetical protein
MQLSNFNSVFEVSIGVHLAYATLRDIHSYHLRAIERLVSHVQDAATQYPKEAQIATLNTSLMFINWRLERRREEVSENVRTFQIIGFVIGIFALVALIIAGIKPSIELTWMQLFILLGFLLLPMPICCYCSFRSHKSWMESMSQRVQDLLNCWKETMSPETRKFADLLEDPKHLEH